ncbi:MAG: SDR family NAD(P)-dependent oxidoreductase [Ignavibacteria bacterium]|nr:SDR family NAD(P)-dependent oxidoreductase [Ignavibacteria bacterium]
MTHTVLITGGTGSFGQAFIKEALKHDVKAIRIFSRGEYLQWQMQQEFHDDRLRWMVGDVRDRDRLQACMRGVDIVVHAAALKHVSTGQYNPQEVIKTNITGSVNVVDAAAMAGVKKVLGISSDKAVHPSCLYGSTKQIMETLFLEANRWAAPKTVLSILRPGNFLESYGNVFEKWDCQAATGELKLTSEKMRRYFIKTSDVAKLAVKLLDIMQGKEIFGPKMREYAMVELLKERYPGCRIKFIGKGPGEKEREQLFADGEQPIDCGDYWMVK